MSHTTLRIERSGSRSLVVTVFVVLVALLAIVGLYGRIMGHDLRRDEFMFVPAAALLQDFTLYREIFFNHVPYSAWLFQGMHRLLPWMGLLEVARFTVFLAWIFLLGTAGWIGWRLTRSWLVVFIGPVSLITADVLLGQTGMAATNNLLPLPFAMLGLGLLSVALTEEDLPFFQLFIAGLALSIAAGLKASAIAFVPAVAIGCFLVPRRLPFRERVIRVALPVALGGIVGAAPLIWYAVTAPDLFFAHILKFHSGPHVAYWLANAENEAGLALSPAAKLQLSYSVWLLGATLLALFLAAFAWVLTRAGDRDSRFESTSEASWIVLVSVATAAIFTFVPTPGFPQYYAPPLIGPPILIALWSRKMPVSAFRWMRPAIGVAMILMLVHGGPRLALGLNDLRHSDNLTTSRMQNAAAQLREAVAGASTDQIGPVATLFPIYPLSAGLDIYPEFSSGPFSYRVAQYTEPDLRAQYVMAGVEDLPALLDANPPSAILTGFDAALEAPFEDFARARGYTERDMPQISDRYGSARLWLPPDADQTGASQ